MTEPTDNITAGLRGIRSAKRALLSGLKPRNSELDLITSDLGAAESVLKFCFDHPDVIKEAYKLTKEKGKP